MRTHSVRVDAVVVQAVIAGALSFSHLHDLAAAAGQDGWKAWAYPVSVDLLLVAAWRRMRQQQLGGVAAGGPRLWFLVALAASLGANVATAGLLDLDDVPAWLRVAVAGWPAVAFFGGTLLAHAQHAAETPMASASPATDADRTQRPAAAVIDRLDRDAQPAPSNDPEPESTAEPAVTPASLTASTVSLPPVLVDRARALAEEHRTATGHPADPDAVRVRLGLPPSMTPSVAAHL